MNNAATATARTASPVRKLTYSALFLALGDGPAVFDRPDPRDRLHALPHAHARAAVRLHVRLAVGTRGRLYLPAAALDVFGMPPIWVAIPMAFEMATYGAIAGLLYRKLPKTGWRIYASLISAMVAGRLVWGLVKFLLAGLQGTEFSLALFLSGAVTTAIPGIILQLILIPILVVVMERTNMALDV